MEHTWQSNYEPKLEISSLETGDIAVCGAFTGRDLTPRDLDADRVCFVAPLSARSDLEWLLRALHRHPNIHHVVVCGDDVKTTGEGLVALWNEGLDKHSRVPKSRGNLSGEFDSAFVDRMRDEIELTDLRGESLEAVRDGIDKLTRRAQAHEPNAQPLPNPVIPERSVFLSRKTTYPIFSSGAGDSWLQLLNLTLRIGTDKQTSAGERIAEALNAVITIETPVLEDGEHDGALDAFPHFLDVNEDDFDRFYSTYAAACLSVHHGADQLEAVCDRLRKSPDTRSGTMVFVQPEDIAGSNTASNLLSATFNTVDQKLFASFVLRSCDVYTDWPLEAMALVRFQRETAARLDLEAGSATFVIHSAHLYEGDWDRSLRTLGEWFKRPLPLHVDPSGVFLFGNDGGKARAMLLNHDASAIQWEDAFSDPEDLSWYIVDVMPWLLPQHIRYVGQECASLMRAMQEKECYLQG